jgi:hypothetical protein
MQDDDANVPSIAPRPALRVAVVMEREASPNRWEAWRFRPVDVVRHEPGFGEDRARAPR